VRRFYGLCGRSVKCNMLITQSMIRCPSQDGSSLWDLVPTGKSANGVNLPRLMLTEVDITTTPTRSSEDVTESYQSTFTFQDGESGSDHVCASS